MAFEIVIRGLKPDPIITPFDSPSAACGCYDELCRLAEQTPGVRVALWRDGSFVCEFRGPGVSGSK